MTKQEIDIFAKKIKECCSLRERYKFSDSVSEREEIYKQIRNTAETFEKCTIKNVPITVTLKYNMDIKLDFKKILNLASDDVLDTINNYIFSEIYNSCITSGYSIYNISKEIKVNNQDSTNLINTLIKE